MFIQMVSGACSRQDAMRSLTDGWSAAMADQPGWLGGTYGFTDDGEFLGIIRFEDAGACRTASERPDAGMWWAGAKALFDRGCEIHQSEDVTLMFDGGSDDAGFVQVIRGRVRDADRLRGFLTDQEMTSMLHQARPEIIGATLAIESDGSFTETVAFTDEASARRGEQESMPEESRSTMAEAMAEVQYLDLHRPWFASHR